MTPGYKEDLFNRGLYFKCEQREIKGIQKIRIIEYCELLRFKLRVNCNFKHNSSSTQQSNIAKIIIINLSTGYG